MIYVYIYKFPQNIKKSNSYELGRTVLPQKNTTQSQQTGVPPRYRMLVFLVTSLSFSRDVHTTTKKHTYVDSAKDGLQVRNCGCPPHPVTLTSEEERFTIKEEIYKSKQALIVPFVNYFRVNTRNALIHNQKFVWTKIYFRMDEFSFS